MNPVSTLQKENTEVTTTMVKGKSAERTKPQEQSDQVNPEPQVELVPSVQENPEVPSNSSEPEELSYADVTKELQEVWTELSSLKPTVEKLQGRFSELLALRDGHERRMGLLSGPVQPQSGPARRGRPKGSGRSNPTDADTNKEIRKFWKANDEAEPKDKLDTLPPFRERGAFPQIVIDAYQLSLSTPAS